MQADLLGRLRPCFARVEPFLQAVGIWPRIGQSAADVGPAAGRAMPFIGPYLAKGLGLGPGLQSRKNRSRWSSARLSGAQQGSALNLPFQEQLLPLMQRVN
jgi:hypothetical protein